MSNSNAGKQFEKDVLISLRSMGHWAERFRDNTWSDMQGSNESPPDMIAVVNQRPVLMELKAICVGVNQRTKINRSLMQGSISLNRCKGHQLERLLGFEQGGHGKSYVVVMFYTPRSVRRCAVMIPVEAWVGARDLYGAGSVRLDRLREHIPAVHHMKWVGRAAELGPYDFCHTLGEIPEEDISIQEHT